MYNKIFDVPDWSMVHNPFHYKSRDSENLLITVGDSWTYGDSLGKTRVRDGVDDTNYRLDHVYGNIITEQLGYDWMNLALPGASNFCMLNWLGRLLDRKYNYRNIACVITLTESGRHEELRWAEKFVYLQPALEHMITKTYSMAGELQLRFPRVAFTLAHNFTDPVPGIYKNKIIERTWLEVLTDQSVQNNTFIVVSDHIKQLNYNRVFSDTPDVIDKALQRIDLLDACAYCCKEDSRHPNETGHKLWAEYLLTQI